MRVAVIVLPWTLDHSQNQPPAVQGVHQDAPVVGVPRNVSVWRRVLYTIPDALLPPSEEIPDELDSDLPFHDVRKSL